MARKREFYEVAAGLGVSEDQLETHGRPEKEHRMQVQLFFHVDSYTARVIERWQGRYPGLSPNDVGRLFLVLGGMKAGHPPGERTKFIPANFGK